MIVVTGGAGFIGSQLIRHLNQQGITDILVVDRMGTSDKYRNLVGLSFSDYVDKDTFIEQLDSLAAGAKTVFHQGACSSTTETDGTYMMANNYTYSKRLLAWCLDNTVDFLYASSASVYGNGEQGFSETPGSEAPLNVYGFSKWVFDQHVRAQLAQQPTSQILGLRYFNVFGPGEGHKGTMASVVHHFFERLKTDKTLALFEGSREFLRDFIYIDDVVAINQYFYQSRQSGIVNCGTGTARSFYDLACAMQAVIPEAQLAFIPFPEHLVGKYQAYTQSDCTQLRGLGCSHTSLAIESAVKRYYYQLTQGGNHG
jgi:ADP-L-glycero-D-manno-heptose 6-epimerase